MSLTKVAKKTKEHKSALITEVRYAVQLSIYHLSTHDSEQVQANADKYDYCWLFDVGNMRNEQLKIVRNLWKECVHLTVCVNLPLANRPRTVLREYFSDEGELWQKPLAHH